jgi:hypothetical protein
MKHKIWKKVKISPELLNVLVCPQCCRNKYPLSADACGCADLEDVLDDVFKTRTHFGRSPLWDHLLLTDE